jgi:hypothetical protein
MISGYESLSLLALDSILSTWANSVKSLHVSLLPSIINPCSLAISVQCVREAQYVSSTALQEYIVPDLLFSGFYIAGIMMYKLGLEFFNGSITTLATDRFNSANTFTKRKFIDPLTHAKSLIRIEKLALHRVSTKPHNVLAQFLSHPSSSAFRLAPCWRPLYSHSLS